MPETSPFDPAVFGGYREETVRIGSRTLLLHIPNDPDRLLDDPELVDHFERSDDMPYWAWLWPTAISMGRWMTTREWPLGGSGLELGCGVGLVSVVAAASGLAMIATDLDDRAVAVTVENARRNGLLVTGERLDWRECSPRDEQFLFGSDLLYETQRHASLLDCLNRCLMPGGEVWLADPGRRTAREFFPRAYRSGWELHFENERGQIRHGPREGEFSMIRLTRRETVKS